MLTPEEVKLLKKFIEWQSLPFTDNLFTSSEEIIMHFNDWMFGNEIDKEINKWQKAQNQKQN